MDDVYYNLIGNDWDTIIETAHFSITLPKAFDPSQVEFMTGSYGSVDTGAVNFTVTGNTIEGTLNRPLSAHEGVTLKVNLPDGYFYESWFDYLYDLFWGNPFFAVSHCIDSVSAVTGSGHLVTGGTR